MAVTREELLKKISEKLGQSAAGGQQSGGRQKAQSTETSDDERARYKALAEKEYQRVQATKKRSGTYKAGERMREQIAKRDALAAADNEAKAFRKNAALAQKEYDDYVNSQEFQKKKQNAATQLTRNTPMSEVPRNAPQMTEVFEDDTSKELKARADYAKKLANDEKTSRVMAQDMAEINAMPEEDRKLFEQYAESQNTRRDVFVNTNPILWFREYNKETDAEKPLLEKYGEERLERWKETYNRYNSQQMVEKTAQDVHDNNDTLGGAVAQNIAGLPARALGGVEALAGRMYELGEKTGRYPTLAPYTPQDALSVYGNTVTADTAERIAGDGDSKLRSALAVGYQAATSAADSATRLLMGGGATGALALAATGSFTNALSEASQKGATPEQAYLMATANAGLEVLTEKVSLDSLLDKAKAAGGSNLRKFLLNTLGQAGVEASEEEANYIGGLIAEAAILKENSEYNQTIAELVANGMSYEEAKAQADKNVWNEAVNTAIISAGSGAMMGAGATAYSNVMAKLGNRQGTQANPQKAAESPQTAVSPETSTDTTNAQTPDTEAAATPQTANELTNALDKLRETGDVSNKTVEKILSDPEAVGQLQERTGLDLSQKATASEKRNAVKTAVRLMAEGTGLQATSEINTALDELSRTGSITDEAANEILFDLDSMRQLQARAGLDTSNRDDAPENFLNAIKEAVRQLAGDTATSARNGTEGTWIDDAGRELAEKAPARQETPEATPERQAVQNAFDRVLGVDTGTEGNYNQINENPTQGGIENAGTAEQGTAEQGTAAQGAGNQLYGASGEGVQQVQGGESGNPGLQGGRNLGQGDIRDSGELRVSETSQSLADKMESRNYSEVGNRNVKAFMDENPDVKPFFQEEAQTILGELNNTIRGDRFFNADTYYNSGGEKGFSGIKRYTSDTIAMLLDQEGFTYDKLENGLRAIIEDHGRENNAASKRLEFAIYDRLMNGYKDFYSNGRVPPSEDFRRLVENTPAAGGQGKVNHTDERGGAKNGMGNGGAQRNAEKNPSGEIAGDGEDGKGNIRSGNQNGVSGGVREGALHTSDSEGRKLTREQAARLQNSAVVDDKGSPIAVYPFTNNMEFDTFAKGDVGFHFSTVEQVEGRSVGKGSANGKAFRAYLDIKNPLRTDVDIISWKADFLSLYLQSCGVLTDAESHEIQVLSANDTSYDSPSSVRLREILEGKGYDGILYPGGPFEWEGDSYVAFRGDQIIRSEVANLGSPQVADSPGQSTGGGQGDTSAKSSVGAADRNFTGTAAYDDLLSDDNVQPRRASDAKNVEVPKVDAYGRHVSESAHNLMNSDIISDRDIDTAKRLIQEGSFGHETQSMDDVRDAVYKEIQKDGMAKSVGMVKGAAGKKKLSEYDIAKAEVLLAMVTDKDGEGAADYASDLMVTLGQMATQSGRQLNMFKLFRKLTPEGQLMTVQKSVQNNVEKMTRSGQVKKGFEASIDPELEQDYLNAAKEAKNAEDPQKQKEAQQKMKDAENAIYQSAAAQMPATMKAKWDAWRYMAMLGNVRTQARNLAGNAMFMPYKAVKDKMGALMELAIPQEQRTKALLTDRGLLQWAKQDAKSDAVQDALKYSGRLGDDVTSQKLFDNRKIFNNKALETARKWTKALPEAGDMIFKNPYYTKSLAGFLTARGYSAGDITGGKVSDTVLDAGRAYAIDEAMKATFNDCNAFSDLFATTLRYKGDSPAGKVANLLGEGIMPFRRTPANIVVRFTEYSPVGLVKGLFNTGRSIVNGKVTASAAIDQLSAGLTGTAAMALGGLLASGIGGIRLTGSDVDDDEKRQGHQAYALEFSVGGKDYSYKIDWAAPANLPLFVGANVYDWFTNRDGEDVSVSKFTAFLRGMGNMMEPMLSLSCLSSLNDVIQSGRYAEDGGILLAVLSDAATSYFTQGIPSLARQTAQLFQENKQTTFANSADPTIRDIQKEAANIPLLGNRYKTDKINAWGEKEKNGTGEGAFNWITRAFDAFANPGTLKEIDNGAVETEIARLNGAQEENVSPPEANKVVSYTDKNGEVHKNQRLTEAEYQKLATTQGQTANRIVSRMIDSKEYAAMTDQQKAQAVKLAYEYAKAKGLSETFSDYAGMDGWKQDIDGKETEAIFRKIVTSEFSNAFDTMEADELDQAYGLYKSLPSAEQESFRKETGGRVGYYVAAKDAGVSDGAFTDLYGTYKELEGNKTMEGKQKAQEWSRTLAEAYEDGRITKDGFDALKEKMVFRQSFPIQTEKFDDLTESGLSSDVADQIIKGLADLQGTGSVDKDTGKAAVTNSDKWGYIAALDGLSDKERDRVMLLYMPDYDPEAEKPNKTELKYAYLRSKGYSAEQFTQTYNVTQEYRKKADMIAAWEALGYSREEAQTFYKLFKGKIV